VNDHDRIIRLEERQKADRNARKLQAREYARRLTVLNGEARRIADVQARSVTAEKFEDYKESQATALSLALDLVDGRLSSLEHGSAASEGHGRGVGDLVGWLVAAVAVVAAVAAGITR